MVRNRKIKYNFQYFFYVQLQSIKHSNWIRLISIDPLSGIQKFPGGKIEMSPTLPVICGSIDVIS